MRVSRLQEIFVDVRCVCAYLDNNRLTQIREVLKQLRAF